MIEAAKILIVKIFIDKSQLLDKKSIRRLLGPHDGQLFVFVFGKNLVSLEK
jgi:hypothetical protein